MAYLLVATGVRSRSGARASERRGLGAGAGALCCDGLTGGKVT